MFFLFQGPYLVMKTKPNSLRRCVNLPEDWRDKASSVLTNGCVVFYTEVDCKSKQHPQLFSGIFTKPNGSYYSKPSKIPNNNFFKTGLNDRIKSFRGCTLKKENV